MMDIGLYRDKEIIGRVYLQYCELSQGLPKEKQVEILPILLSVMHKLTALKYHKTNYQNKLTGKMNHLRKQLKKYKDSPEKIDIRENFDLIAEIEAFIFQIKSCLDILVKILAPTCDVKYSSLFTFGDKGEKIIDILKNNVSLKKYEKSKVNLLIKLIEEDKDKWLSYAIDLRDKTSHEESLKYLIINIQRLPNGDLIPLPPKINGVEVTDLLDTIHHNCITFVQDIFVNAISLLYPNIVLIKADEKTMIDIYKDGESARYIKYGFGLNIPPSSMPL